MKIAHIIPSLMPGGAERVTVALARCAMEAGHDVTLLVGSRGAGDSHLAGEIPAQIAVEYLVDSATSRAGRIIRGVRWAITRRDHLASFDIVHCHLTFGAVLGSVIKILRRGKRPAVLETYHAVGAPLGRHVEWLHRQMAQRRDAFVLMAEHPAWASFSRRHPGVLVRTIRNGAENPRVDSLTRQQRAAYRAQLGIPESCRYVVGTLGRLEPDRRPWLHLPIFERVSRALGSDVHFVFAGGGSQRARLEASLALHGLEGRVHITGVVSEPRFPLSIIDAYVTLNVGSVSGLAGIEAALAGLPVVAIQLDPSYPETDTDWIWSSTDPEHIASRLVALLIDADERQRLARRQQQHAGAHFTNAAMWRAYQDVYEVVLTDTRARSARAHPTEI